MLEQNLSVLTLNVEFIGDTRIFNYFFGLVVWALKFPLGNWRSKLLAFVFILDARYLAHFFRFFEAALVGLVEGLMILGPLYVS